LVSASDWGLARTQRYGYQGKRGKMGSERGRVRCSKSADPGGEG
jgi:hypothetical protein